MNVLSSRCPDVTTIVDAGVSKASNCLVFKCRSAGLRDWWEDPCGLTADGDPTDLTGSSGFKAFLTAPEQAALLRLLTSKLSVSRGRTAVSLLTNPTTWQTDALKTWKPTSSEARKLGGRKKKARGGYKGGATYKKWQ